MLTLKPVTEKPRPWVGRILATIARDAYDHPDVAEMRAAVAELAAMEARLMEMAETAARRLTFYEMASCVADAADEITGECWRWNDGRESRAATGKNER